MNKRFIADAMGAMMLVAGALVLRAKEPTVMTVNGRNVPLSEFEYLYLKNQAQTQLQPLDEYVDIFKLYKLKVADALNLGLDTTQTFRDEYAQYRNELAAPYMTDSAYLQNFVNEAYDFYTYQVNPSHIMMMKTTDDLENRASVNRLDSIRRLIIANKADFTTMARQFSQDRGSSSMGGELGWTNNPNYPYAFLKTIYTLPQGEVSEVVESPMAYHLIMVNGKRKHSGYLSAAHIMLRFNPSDTTANYEQHLKNRIDSIYNVIAANPEKYEEMAVRYSDDKGSGMKGGKLDPFPMGAYPQPFDSVAFSLSDNQISRPIRTPYGWHIIKRFGMRPLETRSQMNDQLTAIVTNPRDIRAELLANRQLENLGKEFGLKPVKKSLNIIDTYIATNGIDSLFLPKMQKTLGKSPLYTYKGGNLTIADMQQQLQNLVNLDPQFASEEFHRRANTALRHKLQPLKELALEENNPEYRNLLHEFRDGSLLYEAGKIRVWDKAATDTVGLRQYFESHRGDYTWQQPRVKGYFIQVTSDSVMQLVKQRIKELKPEQYIPVLRKEFDKQLQIDRVLAQKGLSPMIDYLAFDGDQSTSTSVYYPVFFMADMKILNAPEEMADVRGLVITDYQNYLMQQWEDNLKEQYPVVVNEKVLKKVKTTK